MENLEVEYVEGRLDEEHGWWYKYYADICWLDTLPLVDDGVKVKEILTTSQFLPKMWPSGTFH